MQIPATCGEGLAANASLPSAIAAVLAAVAEVLAHHMTALDLTDEAARAEHEAYAALVLEHRESAMRLDTIAERMTSARDLAMARHDESVMASPEAIEVLRAMVEREEALRVLLEQRGRDFRDMLGSMS